MFDSKKIAKQALLRINELEAKKNRRRTIQRTVSMLSLCAASVVIVFLIFLFGNLPDEYIFIDDEPIPLAAFTFPQIDDNAVPYTGTEQSILIPDINNLIISPDTIEIPLILFNPNGNPYLFLFNIILDETEETIYKSDLIEPGMCIENPTLSKSLTIGEYRAVIEIHFYELDSFTFVNSISVLFNLFVA